MIVNNLKKDQKLVNRKQFLKVKNQRIVRKVNMIVKLIISRCRKMKSIALIQVTLNLLKWTPFFAKLSHSHIILTK